MSVKAPKTVGEWAGLIAALSASLGTLAATGLGLGEYVRSVANSVYDERQERETRLGTLQYLLKDCRERIMPQDERDALVAQALRVAAELDVEIRDCRIVN